MRALREGTAAGEGEVAIRHGSVTGHIYITRGQIAWIEISNDTDLFIEHLSKACGLEESEVHAVLEESRRSSRPWPELFLQWSLVAKDVLLGSMVAWFKRRLNQLQTPGPRAALFLPGEHAYSGSEVRFDPQDLIPEEAKQRQGTLAASEPPTEQERHALEAACAQILEDVEGSNMVAVLDLAQRRVEAKASEEAPHDLLQSELLELLYEVFSDPRNSKTKEMIITRNDFFLFLRSIESSRRFVALVCHTDVVFGNAWLAAKKAAKEIAKIS